jgi:hypothetical protein
MLHALPEYESVGKPSRGEGSVNILFTLAGASPGDIA